MVVVKVIALQVRAFALLMQSPYLVKKPNRGNFISVYVLWCIQKMLIRIEACYVDFVKIGSCFCNTNTVKA